MGTGGFLVDLLLGGGRFALASDRMSEFQRIPRDLDSIAIYPKHIYIGSVKTGCLT